MSETRVGIVAVLGKPNVGKSTLINAIVGQKVSIVSNKPQTTRRRVIGIANGTSHVPDPAQPKPTEIGEPIPTVEANFQIVFLDTPGIHEPHTQLGKAMVDHARAALTDIDLLLFVGDGSHHPGEQDQRIASLIAAHRKERPTTTLLCLNKMDLLKASDVERNIEAFQTLIPCDDYMLTTATTGINIDKLVAQIVERLPVGEVMYDEDEFTDQSSRFLAGELVREQILRATREEIPHSTAVMVDTWEQEPHILRIGATILVERSSQRGIIIGKGGQFLKTIGTKAREEIEKLLGTKVHLDLHVKVSEDWRQNPRILHELDYDPS
ncbi:MAG: GTPase Era [Fimbriimonas sp.]